MIEKLIYINNRGGVHALPADDLRGGLTYRYRKNVPYKDRQKEARPRVAMATAAAGLSNLVRAVSVNDPKTWLA